jgi:glycosyltransferase involved in cell wall biosynthesis
VTGAAPDVWLDAQGAQNRAHFDRGIPRFINEQLRHVVQQAPDQIRAVALNPALPLTGNLNWLLGSGRIRWDGGLGPRPTPLPRIYHAMSPFELDRSLDDLWPRWARSPDVKTVITLFDLIPLVFADHYLRDPMIRSRYLARSELVRNADQVLAISQTTADDATRLLDVPPERITVIDAGVSNQFADAYGSKDEARHIVNRRLPELRPGFLLYVAGIEFRKNIERLIAAYGLTSPAFRTRHQLVITCRLRPEDAAHLGRCRKEAGVSAADLVLTGYVTDAELAALYRTCELFVFASLYEGSGLPILEAMACDVPVIASKTATSPEILGDDAGLFDPYDPYDIARVLEATPADEPLMERLRERSRERVTHYTWDHVAERTLEGYERVAARSARRPRSRRPRIAMFTPWPPEASGIAAYNLRLVRELGRSIDVDIVVGQRENAYAPPQEAGVQLVPIHDLRGREALRAYDRLVYCMGNSDFHGYIYESLRHRRGVVIAHDVRLTGFYGWYAGRERPEDPAGRLDERIRAMYGNRLGALPDGYAPTPETQSALGIYMTQEIQEYAEHIVVHSRYARDILCLDRPQVRSAPPVTVLPLAFPSTSADREPATEPAAPLVVSFGVVSSVKNPQVLIEAFALLARERRGARLVFAGGAEESELARWRAVAADAGVADRVELLGHTSERRWEQLLRVADLAIQLRSISNGEASAAVTECLAAGLPTIVTDHGWAAELPAEAVIGVPVELTAPVLAGAMRSVIDAPSLAAALSKSGREHAESNSFPAMAERYLELLGLT